jgi:hypothetical protein
MGSLPTAKISAYDLIIHVILIPVSFAIVSLLFIDAFLVGLAWYPCPGSITVEEVMGFGVGNVLIFVMLSFFRFGTRWRKENSSSEGR